MVDFLTFVKRIFLYPLAFLFSILGTPLFLMVFVLQFIPCSLYRLFVWILAKLIYRNVKMLSGGDNVLASGKVYTSRNMYGSVNMVLEGKLDLEKFSEEFLNKGLRRRPDGKLKFPEFQCYVESFMGYSFYRPDKHFDIKNHIKLYESIEAVDKRKFHAIRKEFGSKLFVEKRSPWEILVINNYQPDENDNTGKEYSIAIVKVHHCLGDGYTLVTFLFGSFGEIMPLKIPTLAKNLWSKFMITVSSYYNFLVFIGKLPFHLVYKPAKVHDINSWHKRLKKKDMQFVLWSPKPIESDLLKTISRCNKVSITSVLVTACSGAFRKMMEEKGFQSPKSIRVCLSHNLANSPEKMINNSAGAFFNIPLHSSKKTPNYLLQKTNKNVIMGLGVSYNALSHLYRGFIKYFPASFTCESKNSKAASIVTMGIASMPVPSFNVQWAGCNLVEIYTNFEFVDYCLALNVTILKYKDHFFVTFGVERSLLQSNEVCEIEKYFLEELNSLKNSSLTGVTV